ncbi:hypothetical protein B0J11DRAFT_588594 [Dendryphion nanum]|uniref:NACHT domain-containing protein n=1 Tax=Dendryphion nanum TaxID=256645 RepID=A0A9P9J1R6_9PLEO|nr:hypothetical protein B0J11DRAFT_588594 [Dendryphion nanum]
MAMVITKAAPLKADVRLAQAIFQFEQSLSTHQKTVFWEHRAQTLKCAPGIDDVMRLTAEVDQKGKIGSRCIGPRFTSFLHAVQQFAALGDVVVGGSQNIVACGVWSLVRMSLLASIQSSVYAEKISVVFMDIGRSAPRYQELALVYPRSSHLQSYLCEYFIVVVNLCNHTIKWAQKSAIQRFATAISDPDVKGFQADSVKWAKLIHEEMILLIAKRIEETSERNTLYRSLSAKLSRTMIQQQKVATSLRILNSCSKYDYETPWKQIRKAGKTTLLSRNSEYQEWKGTKALSRTLFYYGNLGSGKSVVMANSVDDLIGSQNKRSVVVYYFCKYDIPSSIKSRTIVGSLARQFLGALPDLSRVAEVASKPDESLDSVSRLLDKLLPSDFEAYVILDGLHECEIKERESVVGLIQGWQRKWNLLLCITAELEKCLEVGKLHVGDPAIILDIQNALLKGSQGMFLWVTLQIESLCAMKTDRAIRDALADLPKDLSELFARILQQSLGDGQNYQSKILQILSVAYRPLTADELREALSVIPGDTSWDSARLVNDIYSTLGCCGCLLTVDEEESTIRIVHHSIKQYLTEPRIRTHLAIEQDPKKDHLSPLNVPFTLDHARNTFMSIIVTYLNYDVGSEVSTARFPRVDVGSTPSRVLQAASSSSSGIQKITLKLLKSRKHIDFDVSKSLREAYDSARGTHLEEFHLRLYAREFWLDHLGDITHIGEISCKLVPCLINREDIAPTTVEWQQILDYLGSDKAKIPAFNLVLQSFIVGTERDNDVGVDPPRNERYIEFALLYMAKLEVWPTVRQNGLHEVANSSWINRNIFKMVFGSVLNGERLNYGIWSVAYQQTNFVEFALQHLTKTSQLSLIVSILTHPKVYHDISRVDITGLTILLIEHEKMDAIDLLLDTRLVNIEDIHKNLRVAPIVQGNMLCWATKKGSTSTVNKLLQIYSVDVDMPDDQGETALAWAVQNHKDHVGGLLLNEWDADFFLPQKRSALMRALEHRNMTMMDEMLRSWSQRKNPSIDHTSVIDEFLKVYIKANRLNSSYIVALMEWHIPSLKINLYTSMV